MPAAMSLVRTLMGVVAALPLIGVLAIAAVAPTAIALGQEPPEPGQPVIVVTAPWQSALRISNQAGGRLVAPGRIGAVALVWS